MRIEKAALAGTMESNDVMVTLEPGGSGIEIDLSSVVEKQFGDEIRKVIRETLLELKVESARVTAVDKGALDCTIRARVKAAVFRSVGEAAYPADTRISPPASASEGGER